jgi:hypothetical protein
MVFMDTTAQTWIPAVIGRPFRRGQLVRVKWGAGWQEGTIERVGSTGCDVLVGSDGCWFFTYNAMRVSLDA